MLKYFYANLVLDFALQKVTKKVIAVAYLYHKTLPSDFSVLWQLCSKQSVDVPCRCKCVQEQVRQYAGCTQKS